VGKERTSLSAQGWTIRKVRSGQLEPLWEGLIGMKMAGICSLLGNSMIMFCGFRKMLCYLKLYDLLPSEN
jgi:hypothetical protein